MPRKTDRPIVVLIGDDSDLVESLTALVEGLELFQVNVAHNETDAAYLLGSMSSSGLRPRIVIITHPSMKPTSRLSRTTKMDPKVMCDAVERLAQIIDNHFQHVTILCGHGHEEGIFERIERGGAIPVHQEGLAEALVRQLGVISDDPFTRAGVVA